MDASTGIFKLPQPFGVAPHNLILKKGMPIMMLRNMKGSNLVWANGTRLVCWVLPAVSMMQRLPLAASKLCVRGSPPSVSPCLPLMTACPVPGRAVDRPFDDYSTDLGLIPWNIQDFFGSFLRVHSTSCGHLRDTPGPAFSLTRCVPEFWVVC